MKPRDIQRAVKASHIDRAAGDAPILGHLERVPRGLRGAGRRVRKRGERTRHGRDSKVRREVIFVWSAMFALATLAVLGVAMGVWLWPEMNGAEVAGMSPAKAPLAGKFTTSRLVAPSQEDAVELVKQALLIRDPRKVAEYFHPGSASPEAVVAFLRDLPRVDGVVVDYDWRSSLDANGLWLEEVIVHTQQGDKRRYRMALCTPDARKLWKINFDAFARTVKPSWSELMASTIGAGMVRVIVAPDTYFNGPFSDDGRWSCYGMASPDLAGVLLGYCRRGSPQAVAMNRILGNDNPPSGTPFLRRATLEVRRTAGAESRQFEITRVLAEDWVVSDKAFDET